MASYKLYGFVQQKICFLVLVAVLMADVSTNCMITWFDLAIIRCGGLLITNSLGDVVDVSFAT